MKAIIEVLVFGGASIAIFLCWLSLQKRLRWLVLNPLLMSLITVVVLLSVMDIDYEQYIRGAGYIRYLIEPSVVALGYPLFKQFSTIGKEWRELSLICCLACLMVLTISALFARALGLEDWVIHSLVTLCMTTAIAMETSTKLGGSASLAALMVMIAGFTGSTFGLLWLKFLGISDERAQGLAIGGTAHALGTAMVSRYAYRSSAYASTALILCAIFTAIIAPFYVPFLLNV